MNKDLAHLGTEPISPDAVSGVAVRYDPDFEKLQTEISKLESMDAVAVNWSEVVDLGADILAKKSKDLLVACYVCHGLYEKNSYSGLSEGLGILVGLVDTFWESLFPELKRKRARAAAIEWMVGRLGIQLLRQKPMSSEQGAITKCKALLEQLEDALTEKLGDNDIPWGELSRPLRDYDAELSREEVRQQKTEQKKVEVAVKAQEKESAQLVPASIPPPTKLSVPQEISSERDATTLLRDCRSMLGKLGVYKLNTSRTDPLPYRLLRMAAWMTVELPQTQNGTTQVHHIPAERLTYLVGLFEKGEDEQVVMEVEGGLVNAPFWLDAHRLTASALERLGYREAQQAVIADLAAFLQRFPTIHDCKFVGGVPFADELTRQWIDSEVLEGGVLDVGAIMTSSDRELGESTLLSDAFETAKKLASKGNFREAFEEFRKGDKQTSSRREQFQWNLHLARFCQEIGYENVAISQLEYLDDEVSHYHLEEWEPSLSLQVALLLVGCYKKTSVADELSKDRALRKARVLSRISRLDPTVALGLIQKTK